MAELFKPELESIVAEWTKDAPKGVRAFFTCRSGGVSSGPWGGRDGIMGLNLAAHTGDAKSCVRMNRSIVTQCCPAEPKWITQVHGVTVLRADDVEGAPEADATWTSTPGVVSCVMTADCLPVLIADRDGRIVAAVHAGWRSLADGILQETVAKLRAELPDFRPAVWFGPRIGADEFEVGADVLEAMRRHLPDAEAAFRAKDGGKFTADLGALARQALAAAGVAGDDIADCGLSTHADADRFWSYRRDGEASGRHAALIWIEPAA